jgi:hypothetical protein
MTDSSWYYGTSRVSFRGEFVSGWSNSPEHPLRTGAPPPRSAAQSTGGFSVGSTASEVLEAQGPPTELTDNVWRYGESVVYFKDGKVVRWKTTEENPLNALPETEVAPALETQNSLRAKPVGHTARLPEPRRN